MHTISDKKLLMVRPEELKASSNHLRRKFDEYELKTLADSIAVNGIIQPLAIRRDEQGSLQLIAGERRLKAAVMAGLRRVPCILYKIDESTVALYSVIENMHRSSLTAFEESQGIERLITVFGMSQAEVSARLGVGQMTVLNKLRLLRLDEGLRLRIIDSGLNEAFAEALLNLPAHQRNSALDRIISEGMTLHQAQGYINKILFPSETVVVPMPEDKPLRKTAIGDVRLFSNSLTKLVETIQGAGIEANLKKYETDRYIEYKVRIKKETPKVITATQLRLC